MHFWEFDSGLLDGLGYERPTIKLPANLVKYFILADKLIPLKMDITSVQKMLDLSSCTRTFNCSAAQKRIGYSPIVSLQEGITLTVESFYHLAQTSDFGRYRDLGEQSKANKLLGNGKVADILLWRDEKKTFTCFLLLAMLYYWFFLFGRTFISSVAVLLLLITVLLALYRCLTPNIFGVSIPRITSFCFEISEASVRNCFSAIGYAWNSSCHLLWSFAHGEDWNTFLRIVPLLYTFKVLASYSFAVAIGFALIIAFNAFFIYDQYEEEIDGAVVHSFIYARKSGRWLLMNLRSPLASLLPDHKVQKQC